MAAETPVLIVGAGPVGLMSAILLTRQGIGCIVVDRREGTQRAPAAHVVNARTFEVCRAAGIDSAAIEAVCTPPADAGNTIWMTTLAGEELGRLRFERQDADAMGVTPTPLRNLSQHRFEPILVETLRRLGGEVRWSHEWEESAEVDGGVVSRIREGNRVHQVRSRWLIGSDGAGSRVRRATGIEMEGPGALRSFVMIHFEANLRGLVGERKGVLYWTNDPDATGVFVAHDIDSTWVYMHAWDPEREARSDYTEEVCAAIVRRALGSDAFPFTIRTISPWTMTAQVAERYRAGRIFLVGDSGHRFPPTGGLGLNTGVQDAHNLAWKIAAVEKGWAGEALLDSFEVERHPIAQCNADASMKNSMRMIEVPAALGTLAEPEAARRAYERTLADPAGRERVREAIANQAEHFDMLGLQLGFCYAAGALIPDGTPAPVVGNPVREMVPSARPGSRIPHAWVERDDGRISSLDLFPLDAFTLITTPAGTDWSDAAAAFRRVPIRCLVIGRDFGDPGGAWTDLLGIGSDGAILVRPDQHVAWRAKGAVADAGAVLRNVLGEIVPA